jgi:cyclohexa-1,5-dienecarbonyl-CoA hydratase
MPDKVATRLTHDGAVLWIVLDAPRANIVDSVMMAGLAEVLSGEARQPGIKALVLQGQGSDFSFGASVEEHTPDKVQGMLAAFHGLFHKLAELSLPTLAVVRGRCLGGGLEVASYASWIAASPDAVLGQPEIRLGVFAPAGSVLLPFRVGAAKADQLLHSGRTVKADEALELGLVDVVEEDPEKAASDYLEANILPLSGAALRYATRASRRALHRAIAEDLPAVEALYLNELMKTHDAVEGIQSFLDKRKPEWKNA